MKMKQSNVALVTGASRGIGRAIALQLAEDGYDIAFCFRKSKAQAESLAKEILAMGRECFYEACDISDWIQIKSFTSNAKKSLGSIDLLVNNGSITRDKPLAFMGAEDWNSVIDTNLGGAAYFSKELVFDFIREKKGCIINISSVSGIHGNRGQTNYSASKAAVIGLTKSLSKEVGPYGIRVNAVAPGFIDTDMTSKMGKKVVAKSIENSSLRKLGRAQDVSYLVSFLASEKAQYITGQVIQVDGGLKL